MIEEHDLVVLRRDHGVSGSPAAELRKPVE